MAKATLAVNRETREPRLVDDADYVKTRDALAAANNELNDLEDQWRTVQRNKKSLDAIVRIDAEIAERELELTIRRKRGIAERARGAHDAARREAQQRVNAWHVERIKEPVPAMLADLASFREGAYATVQQRVAAAIAAGVVPSSLPLAELSLSLAFGRISGQVYTDQCASVLKKFVD